MIFLKEYLPLVGNIYVKIVLKHFLIEAKYSVFDVLKPFQSEAICSKLGFSELFFLLSPKTGLHPRNCRFFGFP